MNLFIASMAIVAMVTVCLAENPCPSFWVPFEGSCYRFFGDRVTWPVAKENCRDHYTDNGQADLISIHSREENSFAYDLFRSNAGGTGTLAGHTYYGAWIGLYQNTSGSTGPFIWTDGTSNSDFESWVPWQPDNYGGNEDCGHFWRRGDVDDTLQSWNDASCTDLDFSYICKVAQNPMAIVAMAHNPCPSFWVPFKGACYRYFGDRVTWPVAKENCKDHCSDNGQADLISIHSREENSFAYDLFRSNAGGTGTLAGHTYYGAWIGLYQTTSGSTGPFVWTDGTSNSDFESWVPGQPDNYGGNEDCGHLWRRGDVDDTLQSWNDAPCTDLDFSYICKVAQN